MMTMMAVVCLYDYRGSVLAGTTSVTCYLVCLPKTFVMLISMGLKARNGQNISLCCWNSRFMYDLIFIVALDLHSIGWIILGSISCSGCVNVL